MAASDLPLLPVMIRLYLDQLRFALVQPDQPAEYWPFDAEAENMVKAAALTVRLERLRPLRHCRRMSSLPLALLIGLIIERLPPGSHYLNIGVWHGFTLFAGMLLSPDTPCIGLDNFSEFGNADRNRQAFLARFQQLRTGAHQQFYEVEYRAFFAREQPVPVGLYFYDGAHDYASQLEALELGDPWVIPGGIVLVDDTNAPDPRQATLDFLAQHKNYALIADVQTANTAHPTYWNGVMVLVKKSR